MNRKDLWWIAGGALGALVFWQAWGVDGSGTPLTERRAAGDVSEIEVHGDVRVEIEVGDDTGIEVSGDDNVVPLIETRVDGDRPSIRSKRDFDAEVPLVVRVTMPDVRKIEGSGAVDIAVDGVDNDELAIEVSGAATVSARGRTDRLHVDISGSGEAALAELEARAVDLELSGAGEVDLGEPEELDVDVSGAGTVRYAGSPRIDQDVSGAAKIVRR
jgi:hypothetical protein